MRRSVVAMLFLLLSAMPALGDGLQPGTSVRCIHEGVAFSGTITGVHPVQEALLVIDRAGEEVLVPLAELDSIRALGKKRRFVWPWESPDEELPPQFVFRMVDGSRVVGAADPEPSFDLTGTSGAARTIGLEELQLIEVQ